MRKAYIFLATAPSVAILVFWTGCAARQQQGAAIGDGGTNLAYMAEGTPTVTSTGDAAPGQAPATMPSAAQRTVPQESFQYTVQPGDSLWKIANKHGTSVSLLQKMNNMPPDKITIRVGDKIMIPGKEDADKLRQVAAPSTTAPAAVPTVTVPTTRTTAPAVTTTRTPTPTTTVTAAPTVVTPAATITTPSATITTPAVSNKTPATSTGPAASWLPPSYRTPQTGAATAAGSAKTPDLTIAPGSATLSPSTIPTAPTSEPPPSLTVPPAQITTPIGGMTLQAVGPTGSAPVTTPQPTPPSK